MPVTPDAVHPHDEDAALADAPPARGPKAKLARRVRDAIARHGQHRVSVALGLSRPTCLALAAGLPTLAITILIAVQRLHRLDELDQIADAEDVAEADRGAAERARVDALRDAAGDAGAPARGAGARRT